MPVDQIGIYRYEPKTLVNSLPSLLNLGMSSVSNAIRDVRENLYFGGFLVVANHNEIPTKVKQAKDRTGVDPSPTRPMFFYITSSRIFATWDGSSLFRVAGGDLYRYTYLTANGNFNARSGLGIRMGGDTFDLEADSFVTLHLSALLFPDGGASGNFYPVLNDQRLSPNASWSSYGQNSRMSVWFTWVGRAKQGRNNLVWNYQHSSGNSGANTIVSTVHTWVRY